jgi:uncharacterized protein
MRIRVDSIPEEGQRIEGEIDSSAIRLDMPVYRLAGAFSFSGRAARRGESVILKGNLTGSVDSRCGRCLNNFEMPIDITVDTIFSPRIEREDDETEVVEVDESFSFYDGDSIDLQQEAKELILVSLPIKPVCREDCRGLCPKCGVDLNTNPCGCGSESGPSPFDKLKELKAKLEK